MHRRLGLILGLLVLLALAAAWAFVNGRAAYIAYPRGLALVGAHDGRLLIGLWWGPVKPGQRWQTGTGYAEASRSLIDVTAVGNGDHRAHAVLPIWPLMLVVTVLLWWRVRSRRRREAAGFPMGTTASADGGSR